MVKKKGKKLQILKDRVESGELGKWVKRAKGSGLPRTHMRQPTSKGLTCKMANAVK